METITAELDMAIARLRGDLSAATAKSPWPASPPPATPAAPAEGSARPSTAGRGHTRVSAWRERRRLAAAKAGTTISPADDSNPVTMTRVTGVELLRSLRAEADRMAALDAELRDRIDVLADPTAAEAEAEVEVEVEAISGGPRRRRRAAEADQTVAFRCTGKRFLPLFLASFIVPSLALVLIRE